MLISTKPNSEGKKAVLFRSRQLTEFRWTPVCDVPMFSRTPERLKFSAGEEYQGMMYSSPEPVDKFLFENISFETLLSMIANPDSALYTKDLGGHHKSWTYCGFVCNGLARYALNIRRRYSTKRWPTVPGMRKVADDGCYTAEQIEVCDVLYAHGKGRSHVALITDVLRDESGEIRQIEVSEATPPVCIRRQFDLEEFFEKFKLFALWRYDFVDSVPMPDEEETAWLNRGVPELPTVAVDYGNKSNYRTCEDVVISAFAEGENGLEICRGGMLVERITIMGRGKVSRRFERGYYTVKHTGSGECVEFCVTEPQISHTVENGTVTVRVDSCDPESRILYMDFREKSRGAKLAAGEIKEGTDSWVFYNPCCASLSKLEELTDEEKNSGTITRAIPDDAENFKIYFENKYGVWTHTMIALEKECERS